MRALGYTIVEGRDVDAFAIGILGMQRGSSPGPGILVRRGDAGDIVAAGFEAASPQALAAAIERARAAGVVPVAGTVAEARLRRVSEFVWFTDPEGNHIELALGLEKAGEPFVSALFPGGFKSASLGMGHYVLVTVGLG